ncbi:MAG: pyridoxamine 5'-phosphate oxidase family protein [Microthrixaceae bacterium]
MLERPEDLDALQRTLDESYRNAGEHLKQIHEPQRRPDAAGLAQLLRGMCLLTLATVTRDGRPITGAVDGVFYRGAFHFGSSPESVRFGHIRQRPEVSATHLPGEHLAVTVHGTAQPLDLAAESTLSSASCCWTSTSLASAMTGWRSSTVVCMPASMPDGCSHSGCPRNPGNRIKRSEPILHPEA